MADAKAMHRPRALGKLMVIFAPKITMSDTVVCFPAIVRAFEQALAN